MSLLCECGHMAHGKQCPERRCACIENKPARVDHGPLADALRERDAAIARAEKAESMLLQAREMARDYHSIASMAMEFGLAECNRLRDRPTPTMTPRVCPTCGEFYVQSSDYVVQGYCSRECSQMSAFKAIIKIGI